jgi:hypothetical protein
MKYKRLKDKNEEQPAACRKWQLENDDEIIFLKKEERKKGRKRSQF